MFYMKITSDSTMKSINFEFGENTEAYFACTTVLHGETLILGGQKQSNQVSKDID